MGCAQQVAPTGGPRDEIGPEILKSEPENQSNYFNGQEIELQFDEYVRLDRLKEQLIISPPLKYDLQTTIRGKSLKIEIQDTLKENTTYVFNFGNAIVDIRENNPLESFKYVFSTGAVIDSNRIAGSVIDAFEGEAVAEVYVMAYKTGMDLQDSIPYLQKPDYLALSDELGQFSLDYLQAGEYKLFALKEDNDNYLFDLLTEPIGFLDEWVSTDSQEDSVKLFLFEEDHELQFLKEQKEKGPSSQLIFNLPIDSLSYSSRLVDSMELNVQAEFISKDKDTVELWWPETKLRFPLIIQADTLTDTLNVAIDSLSKGKQSALRIKKFGPYRYFSPPSITFSQPIAKIDTSRLQLWDADSNAVNFELGQASTTKEYRLNFERKAGANYRLIIDSAAFTDLYGYQNDSSGFVFKFDEPDDYGSLQVNIESPYDQPLVLHLRDQRGNVLRKAVLMEPAFTFEHLKAGSYTLKLIIDGNGNGRWDTGNYLEGLQPEKVINYEGEIRIRERWDKEVDWIIN